MVQPSGRLKCRKKAMRGRSHHRLHRLRRSHHRLRRSHRSPHRPHRPHLSHCRIRLSPSRRKALW